MIRGVRVTVQRPVEVGRDAFNAPVVELEEEAVEDVLYARSADSDNVEGARTSGTLTKVTFYFPKAFTRPLRGCHVVLGGRRFAVVGDPLPYIEENTPGKWNYTVEAVEADG